MKAFHPSQSIRISKFVVVLFGAFGMSVHGLHSQSLAPTFESGSDDITLSDEFQISAEKSDTPLNERVVGKSEVIWEATPNTVLLHTSNGEGVGTSEAKNIIGRIGVPTDANLIEIEAKVRPTLAEKGKNWVAIGVGNSALGNPTFGGLYLLLDSEGRYILIFNRNSKDTTSSNIENLAIGPLLSFDPNGWNTLKLTVDKKKNSVSAWANDERIANGLSLTEKGIDLDTAYAGFSAIHQLKGEPKIDDVSFRFEK